MTRRQAEVIMALASNGLNTTRGAKAMYMSRTGFDYHVQQLKKITGMDPQDFYDMKVLEEEASRLLRGEYESKQHHATYTVYRRKTDLPVIIGGTSRECAAAMGITLSSFYTIVSKQRNGHKGGGKKWEIFLDDPEEEEV